VPLDVFLKYLVRVVKIVLLERGGGGGVTCNWLCHHCIASVTRGYYTMI
jgi:hypothetical protein